MPPDLWSKLAWDTKFSAIHYDSRSKRLIGPVRDRASKESHMKSNYNFSNFMLSIEIIQYRDTYSMGPILCMLYTTLRTVNNQLHVYYEKCWKDKLNAEFARAGQDAGGNKLRTYRRFKESYTTEQYVEIVIQKKYIGLHMQSLDVVWLRSNWKNAGMG